MKTVGFNARTNMRRFFVFLFLVGLLSACTDAPVKEFFCESTDNEGGANFYKQQIVLLSDKEMCVLWPANSPTCVQTNQAIQTPWQENQETQIKHQEKLELRITRESAVLQILQNQKSMNAQSSNDSPISPLMKFEFKKRPEVLTVFTSAVDKEARIYACKPWAKRHWWSIY